MKVTFPESVDEAAKDGPAENRMVHRPVGARS